MAKANHSFISVIKMEILFARDITTPKALASSFSL